MNNILEIKRRAIIALWVAISGFLLWVMSFLPMATFEFRSFINFLCLVFGGSAAYHFLTEMLSKSITAENNHTWNLFINQLLKVFGVIVFVTCVALFEKYIYHFYGLPTLFFIGIATVLLGGIAGRAHDIFRKIQTNNS